MYILKYLLTASLVVKIDMLLLLGLSILVWSAFFNKIMRINIVTNYVNQFENSFWSGISMEDFYNGNKQNLGHPLGIIFANAMEEWNSSKISGYTKTSLLERVSNATESARVEIRKVLEKYQPFFLTVTSLSPLLGLFGTVCGIITTFHALDLNGNANIAAIAPGVAEALITTAFSIFVAICSAVVYNFFNTRIALLEDRIDIFNIDLINLISRELDGGNGGTTAEPEPIVERPKANQSSGSTSGGSSDFGNLDDIEI